MREERGLSQERLAGWAGISQAHLSRLESGVCNLESLTLKAAANLAWALGVPVEGLLKRRRRRVKTTARWIDDEEG